MTTRARRQTLAAVSNSTLNSRPSLGRQSLAGGGSRKSIGPGAARMSLGGDMGRAASLSIGMSAVKQPRKSSAARRSSVIGRAADPRPVTEKAYMNEMLRTLVAFLLDNNYDQRMEIAMKPGWRPTKKEFEDIVTFLFKLLDPNWQPTPGKFDEEFIQTLKNWRYPYIMSKTSLAAVGSPHVWPQLLGSMQWIVELLTYDKVAVETGGHAKQAFGGEVEDMTREGDLRFTEYLEPAYGAFLAGDDPQCEALELEFAASFKVTTAEVNDLVKLADDEQMRLVTEIDTEKKMDALVPEKKTKLAVLNSDTAKLIDFVEQLKEHHTSLEQKVSTKKADLANGAEELTQCREKVASLKERIAEQELTPDDARRMVEEKERLERNLKEAEEYHVSMNQRAWESEIALNSKIEELERTLHSYGTLATQLQLLPLGAMNAHNVDFRILVNKERISTAASVDHVLSTDVTSVIMPALQTKCDLVNKKGAAFREDLNQRKDDEQRATELLQTATDRFDKLQGRHSKLEEQLRREEEGLEAALAERAKEQEAIEAEADSLLDNPAERERRRCESEKRIALLRSRQQEGADRRARDADHAQELVLTAIQQLTAFKEHTNSRLDELRAAMDRKLANAAQME